MVRTAIYDQQKIEPIGEWNINYPWNRKAGSIVYIWTEGTLHFDIRTDKTEQICLFFAP